MPGKTLPGNHFIVSSRQFHGSLTAFGGLEPKIGLDGQWAELEAPFAKHTIREGNRMQISGIENIRPVRDKRLSKIFVLALLGAAAAALATPPMGFVLNQIVAMGSTTDNIGQQVQIAKNANLDDEPWQVQLQAQGATDFYVQQLALAPGGYSGWHTHPGVLIGSVVSGSIDFYDANCQKRTFTAGQAFLENSQVHAISNTGTVNAELTIAYLVKHNASRRIEADAPTCASSTMVP